jgi:hypothetical protein
MLIKSYILVIAQLNSKLEMNFGYYIYDIKRSTSSETRLIMRHSHIIPNIICTH